MSDDTQRLIERLRGKYLAPDHEAMLWEAADALEAMQKENERLQANADKAYARCDTAGMEVLKMHKRIAELEGDLEVMRLQRDAKLVSETPRDNALKQRIAELEAKVADCETNHYKMGPLDIKAHLEAALKGDKR